MAEVIMAPRDARWFRVGDITLCETCDRAMQLQVKDINGLEGPVAIWVHLGPSVAGHWSEPALSWAEAAHYRDVPEGRA